MTAEPIDATPGRGGWTARFAAVASLAAVWALLRPYAGIVHDSRIYIGRALADLSPQTIGLEYAFLHDGQSRFSLFPRLIDGLVAALGPGLAAELISAAGLALWVSAAAYLLSRFLRGPSLWAALACLAAFPARYGGYDVFSWAEPFATPRIFAEAASLVALGLLLDGRRLAAAALLAIAIALHPLVALPIAAAAVVLLGFADRRWWLLFPAAGLAALGAALAGAPVADRLLQPIDPQWLAVLQHRSPFLFPRNWAPANWALLVCQAATLILTYRGAPSGLRRLIVAAGVVGALGIAASALVPTLLVVQLQLWRAAWLVSVLAAGLFAFCAVHLWRGGRAPRSALAMLAAAWIGQASLPIAAFICGLAILLAVLPRAEALPRWALGLTWPYLLLIAVGMAGVETWHLLRSAVGLPLEAWLSAPAVASTLLLRAGLVAFAVWWALRPPPARPPSGFRLLAAVAVVGAVIGFLTWDARPPFAKMAEARPGAPRLASTVPGGSVVWLDDRGSSWLLTGEPEWWSLRQGAGGLFDRQLALEWRRRFDILARAHMVRPDIDFAAAGSLFGERPVGAASLREVCASNDGPAWIVAPLERVEPASLALAASIWRPAAQDIVPAPSGGRMTRISAYAIFSCSRLGGRPSAPNLAAAAR